jgi:hypothetical protein
MRLKTAHSGGVVVRIDDSNTSMPNVERAYSGHWMCSD